MSVLTLPFGVLLAVPTYLLWRASHTATSAQGQRPAVLWAGIGLFVASSGATLLHSGTTTCWLERVTASGAHDYIVLSSHSGVSGRSALGDVGGGCAQFPTAAGAMLSLVLAVAALCVLVIAARTPHS